MRFLVDMPLSPELAAWLVDMGHDAFHAAQLGLDRPPDDAILERARAEGRVVVTADLDYSRILALTRAAGPGLVLFRGGNFSESELRERFTRLLESVPGEELPHSVIVVEKERIRRRRLPLQSGRE
jgi:predicted nuclease of predicted toxin-antitoxin system